MTGVTHRYGRVSWGAGAWLVLAAACVCGQEDEQRIERWLAERADMMAAWEALSGKWEAVRAATEEAAAGNVKDKPGGQGKDARAAAITPVENIVLPLDHYKGGREDGRIRTLLRAEKAYLLGEDLVFAWNVKVEMLLPDGKPDGTLLAEDCLIDRNAKRGFCRGAVDVKTGPDHLKGRGMYFSTDDKLIKLLSECEIRTIRIPASLGRLS